MSRRNMQHLFSQVPKTDIPRSRFNRSHGYKTTLDEGYLIPILVDEVLPGDTFNLKATIFTRLSTLISPIMDNLFIDTFFFYVPERLVFDKFQRMCGEVENPDDSTDFLFPSHYTPQGFEAGSLADYFGLPTNSYSKSSSGSITKTTIPVTFRCEPFRAYWLIWNEWFRDENLQDSAPVAKGETYDIWTDDTPINDGQIWSKPARRGKRHDYFTSALPWPQKGPGVELPFGGSAPIVDLFAVSSAPPYTGVSASNFYDPMTGQPVTNNVGSDWDATWEHILRPQLTADGKFAGRVDLTQATSVTINQFREAFQIQKWYERAARGGTRYTEILRSFFGVISPDARLQRPEYLGGSSDRIQISTVAQTSASNDTTPQANLAAFGVGVNNRSGFTKSFVEHGWIIGLVNVRADLTYQQGISRMWSRKTKFDMYWPVFAHLGEQAIFNKEIFAQGTSVDDEAFGYQERYAEYRYFPSMITGKFRSTNSQPLDSWHLAQKFENLPTLSSEFIEEHPPVDRIVAVQNEPHFLMDIWFDMNCVRPMPVYSVPGLIDHF